MFFFIENGFKVYTKKGFQAAELKSLYKEFSEEVIREARYEIKFDSGEFGQDDEDDYIDESDEDIQKQQKIIGNPFSVAKCDAFFFYFFSLA